jgi:dipeptidyl aminopeptidase/acylaminoacyl peptidase
MIRRRTAALAVFAVALCVVLPAAAVAKGLEPDALTKAQLDPAEFERISISPDGSKLAIARHLEGVTKVTIHNRSDLQPIISFDPGSQGAISYLRWADDQRLIVGATRMGTRYGFAAFDPVLVVATLDGKPPTVLPGEYFTTVEGDPDRILVSDCSSEKGKVGCKLPEIRRRALKDDKTEGELLIQGPAETRLFVNRAVTAAFATKVEDDDTGRLYVYKPATKTWDLLNDASQSGFEVWPIDVSRDGKTGLLRTERKEGPDLVERYDFATGERTPLYTDKRSNPIEYVTSLDGQDVVGAFYEPTQPRLQLWLPQHPDAKILADLQAAFPGRYVDVVSTSADQQLLVLFAASDREPGVWYLFDRAARKASVLARSRPAVDPARQGTTRAITLKARDGLELHGLLTVPAGSSGKNLPLVVTPHGGPHWIMDRWGYDDETQMLAQHGYAVLQVNFRGSGGYGREFLNKGRRQWGGDMINDINDATRWAIAEGVADPRRVCIYGVSYGGYAALMAPIREPDLYRCIAAYAAPADLALLFKWGTARRSDVGKRYLDKVIGNDKAELAANSPAKLADRIKVPVLLAHGYRDARVDIRHAHAMRSALRKNDVRLDYAEYSDTGHFLVIKRHRLDFYARLFNLLEANLGGTAPAVAAPVATATAPAATP